VIYMYDGMYTRKGGERCLLPDTNDGGGFNGFDSFQEAKGFSFLGVRVR
jgi:hypothetical protein